MNKQIIIYIIIYLALLFLSIFSYGTVALLALLAELGVSITALIFCIKNSNNIAKLSPFILIFAFLEVMTLPVLYSTLWVLIIPIIKAIAYIILSFRITKKPVIISMKIIICILVNIGGFLLASYFTNINSEWQDSSANNSNAKLIYKLTETYIDKADNYDLGLKGGMYIVKISPNPIDEDVKFNGELSDFLNYINRSYNDNYSFSVIVVDNKVMDVRFSKKEDVFDNLTDYLICGSYPNVYITEKFNENEIVYIEFNNN